MKSKCLHFTTESLSWSYMPCSYRCESEMQWNKIRPFTSYKPTQTTDIAIDNVLPRNQSLPIQAFHGAKWAALGIGYKQTCKIMVNKYSFMS